MIRTYEAPTGRRYRFEEGRAPRGYVLVERTPEPAPEPEPEPEPKPKARRTRNKSRAAKTKTEE